MALGASVPRYRLFWGYFEQSEPYDLLGPAVELGRELVKQGVTEVWLLSNRHLWWSGPINFNAYLAKQE